MFLGFLAPFVVAPVKPKKKLKLFDKEHFIAWLETKHPKKMYDYADIHNCLISQYLKAYHRYWAITVGPWHYRVGLKRVPLSESYHDIAIQTPHTFGAALERAERLL